MMNNTNDSYVNKFHHEQSNLNSRYTAKHNTDPSNGLSDQDQKCSNEHLQSSNVELCDKIRHFTEEIKEKFKKKKNRSSLSNSTNSKLDCYKSNDLSESSDLDELTNEPNRSITRIKINQSGDETEHYSNSNYFNSSSQSNLSQSLIHSSTSLSPCLGNFSRTSLSQTSLLKNESRSPFINRALPPLPPKPQNGKSSQQGDNDCLKDDFYSREHLSRDSSCSKDFGERTKDKTSKRLDFESGAHLSMNGLDSRFDNSDDQSDDESKLTNCFKLHKDHKKPQSSNKPNKIKNYLTKKYSHPPPHLHSNANRNQAVQFDDEEEENNSNHTNTQSLINLKSNLTNRNQNSSSKDHEDNRKMFDYAKNIEIIKDCGWYYGSISGKQAEKILENEPEGSFIVRDSSDENYIFSLAFKTKDETIHVRIEHDQGNFSFGCLQKFSSSTIVDFISEAVEYSRTGRFLFFLHRLPIIGPLRVQLLYPISRFKNVQSLKYLCRFTILKHVRRDHISKLPIPDFMKEYLSQKNYLIEMSS